MNLYLESGQAAIVELRNKQSPPGIRIAGISPFRVQTQIVWRLRPSKVITSVVESKSLLRGTMGLSIVLIPAEKTRKSQASMPPSPTAASISLHSAEIGERVGDDAQAQKAPRHCGVFQDSSPNWAQEAWIELLT